MITYIRWRLTTKEPRSVRHPSTWRTGLTASSKSSKKDILTIAQVLNQSPKYGIMFFRNKNPSNKIVQVRLLESSRTVRSCSYLPTIIVEKLL